MARSVIWQFFCLVWLTPSQRARRFACHPSSLFHPAACFPLSPFTKPPETVGGGWAGSYSAASPCPSPAVPGLVKSSRKRFSTRQGQHPHVDRRRSTAEMEVANVGDTVVKPLKEFGKNSVRLVKRCTKPDRKGECSRARQRGRLMMGRCCSLGCSPCCCCSPSDRLSWQHPKHLRCGQRPRDARRCLGQ
jgi:hypothetical protein